MKAVYFKTTIIVALVVIIAFSIVLYLENSRANKMESLAMHSLSFILADMQYYNGDIGHDSLIVILNQFVKEAKKYCNCPNTERGKESK